MSLNTHAAVLSVTCGGCVSDISSISLLNTSIFSSFLFISFSCCVFMNIVLPLEAL